MVVKKVALRVRKHVISFKAAFAGIFYAFKSQPNFTIHLAAVGVVLFLAFYLKVTTIEFIILVFTIVLVLVAEMINTSVESITDLVTTEWRQQAKIAKDVSAGMVLVTAVGAVIIGLLIFVKYLIF